MKMFPAENYTIKLRNSVEKSIELLKMNTSESSNLSTHITSKNFIGTINTNSFKIIGSEIGIGVFTVFNGCFINETVTITTEVNKPFKILILILSILIFSGFIFAVFVNGTTKSFGLLIPFTMGVLFIRYGLIGLFYKVSFNLTYGKLKNLLSE